MCRFLREPIPSALLRTNLYKSGREGRWGVHFLKHVHILPVHSRATFHHGIAAHHSLAGAALAVAGLATAASVRKTRNPRRSKGSVMVGNANAAEPEYFGSTWNTLRLKDHSKARFFSLDMFR